jgi:pyridoxamine 5'-phosphate oxidase
MIKPRLENPNDIRQQVWRELEKAVHNRHHDWRTPVMATVSSDDSVNARTVVLRQVDQLNQSLMIYTDQRSLKVREIIKQPKAVFAFWSKRLNWQLRVDVEVSVMSDLKILNTLWETVRDSPSAMDYLGTQAPGTSLTKVIAGQESAIELHHFTVLTAVVKKIDWLELSREGHRRALITPDSWEWLAP